ncbi:hypothetical protein H6G00_22645 [Leptolyngbya sp. FACHB-541]|uniref:hypothetical protein n=1 Tax=Leptolyngbya sp. FACHB-541 TaxID=2692810 RepID=UPI001681F9E9|nr:hypothetical protein [Leptolyngbya sp. FACHB-541]MBD1999374.1 hypothetical protein [Leptolyngbya sp. FACHB-541]
MDAPRANQQLLPSLQLKNTKILTSSLYTNSAFRVYSDSDGTEVHLDTGNQWEEKCLAAVGNGDRTTSAVWRLL